jgi:hypothetical protein
MELVQALQDVLSVAGAWLALSVLTWALLYPLFRAAGRSDAAMTLEEAEAKASARLALRGRRRSGSSPGRS